MKPGSRIAHFEVLGLIGTGGMGEVYRARDTRLGRDVAVKVLPAEFVVDPERLRRFEVEARAVAALSHPNVLAVYDVGTHEGSPYLVTELLEGESLQDRLRPGALPVRKAVETAVQIAQGLAAAHEKGIVHRDLKPGNVFITRGGHVKILDFGLAKLAPLRTKEEQATATTVTEATDAGTVLGTAAYMSPEQVRGKTVDQRSDIFAFGCVLYEMLSGRRAFAGATRADTLSAILREGPPPLTTVAGEVSRELDVIVVRCLEKRPEDRYQSTRDLAHDLAMIVPVSAPRSTGDRPKTPKIVVLPFENLGGPEDAYFAAGMTEEITRRLANVQGLGVISRTSAAELARRGKTVKEIGAELGVEFVLEGTVAWEHRQDSEDRVRITPQLIRAADDIHIWAERYERVLADVFAIQSEVAENAVRAMGVALRPGEQRALRGVLTNNLEAYDLYLRGQELSARSSSKRDLEGALAMYQAAIDRDPRFAPALAGMARENIWMFLEFDRSHERLARAREAAEQAIDLRPDTAEAHSALGWYLYLGLLDYPRALDEFGTALRMQPNNSEALFGSGCALRRQGHWAQAVSAIRRALELDPLNVLVLNDFAVACQLAWRYADADRALELAIALNPQWGEPHAWRAWLQLQWHGDLQEARALLERARDIPGIEDEAGHLTVQEWRISLICCDYEGALRQLAREARHTIANQMFYLPVPLLVGLVHWFAGRRDLAEPSLQDARRELEARTATAPQDARCHSALGIVYAGLGRLEAAVREADLGCNLMPATRDALLALDRREDLALVYAMAGRRDDAIALLHDLLRQSGWITAHLLRMDPRWDLLRSEPCFQALLDNPRPEP